jgi:hypothetical protein
VIAAVIMMMAIKTCNMHACVAITQSDAPATGSRSVLTAILERERRGISSDFWDDLMRQNLRDKSAISKIVLLNDD